MKVTQRTIEVEDGKETIIDVNGCSVVHAVFNKDFRTCRFGFVVRSFIADDNGKIVDKGRDWSDVRSKARSYAKENFHRHAEKHGLTL